MTRTLHPLAAEGVVPIPSWDNWLRLWEETNIAEFRHSLLHFGFNIETGGGDAWYDRILFYLKYADGFGDSGWDSQFKFEERPAHVPHFSSFGERLSIIDVRKQVARKAFDMLCEHLFKDTREDRMRLPSWFEAMSNPKVFEAVLHFFRPDERGGLRNFPNGDRDRKREIVQKFLTDLVTLGWKGINFNHRVPKEVTDRLTAARPRFVEILCGMGRPDHLLEMTSGFHRVEPLDGTSLRKLYEIAMDQDVAIPYENADRKPKTIEEAAASGSKAAMVYLILKSREKEFIRLRMIRELEDERAKLEKQIEQVKA